MSIAAITCMLVLLASSDAAAFVTHDYPATFINEAARVYFLLACIIALSAILRNRLHKEKGWQYIFYSLIFFILWDLIVFSGQIAALRMDAGFEGGDAGWEYFKRSIVLGDKGYFFYLASYDYVFIDIAMFLFYKGLREQLSVGPRMSSIIIASIVLPMMPVFAVSFIGAGVFIILSLLSLNVSIRLYRRERENIIWNYMIWLSAAFVLFSISRSVGHIFQHILTASGYGGIWKSIEPISGGINIIIFFLVGSITVFFIRIYDIYLLILDDKKKIETINQDLSELNQELEDIVAERTMSLMALTVADKVRNPAAVIGIVCKRVLRNKERQDKALNEDLLNVISECEKLQNVVGDFENLLKTKRSQFAYESLNDVVREVVPVVASEAEEKGVLLSIHLSDRPVKINMQKSLLRVAIFHVLRNAVDATPAGGLIKLSTSARDEAVALTISDAGAGIETEDLEKIFDIFYSTKRKGYGMGLPLVKQIITEHLGEVRVESEKGKGTVFEMVFPSRWKADRTFHPDGPRSFPASARIL